MRRVASLVLIVFLTFACSDTDSFVNTDDGGGGSNTGALFKIHSVKQHSFIYSGNEVTFIAELDIESKAVDRHMFTLYFMKDANEEWFINLPIIAYRYFLQLLPKSSINAEVGVDTYPGRGNYYPSYDLMELLIGADDYPVMLGNVRVFLYDSSGEPKLDSQVYNLGMINIGASGPELEKEQMIYREKSVKAVPEDLWSIKNEKMPDHIELNIDVELSYVGFKPTVIYVESDNNIRFIMSANKEGEDMKFSTDGVLEHLTGRSYTLTVRVAYDDIVKWLPTVGESGNISVPNLKFESVQIDLGFYTELSNGDILRIEKAELDIRKFIKDLMGEWAKVYTKEYGELPPGIL